MIMVKRQSVKNDSAVPKKVAKKEPISIKDEKVSHKQVLVKGRAPVDSCCTEMVGIAHVHYEEDVIYDVMLNQTNVQFNNNKFFIIQLLKNDTCQQYSVWFRWGRVGLQGQSKLEKFGGNLEYAKRAFMKKFLDKTGNHWDNRDKFARINGKYDMVKLDYCTQNQAAASESSEPKTVESKLPAAVQALMQLICDLKSMEEAMTELSYDARRAPLGKLTKEQIRAGYSALSKVADCVNALTKLEQPSKGKKRAPKNAQSKKELEDALLMACNEFYTRIPHGFGMRIPPVLRTLKEVKEKLELLEALEDIEYAVNIMKKKTSPNENVMDKQYGMLQCDLNPLDKNSSLYAMLKEYLLCNHGSTHHWYKLELLDIFECTKPSEATNFKDCGNKMLLWHGSRLSNWMGILGRGLRIAPPEAPCTGYMFGKGVYFADCSSKSANYVYPTQAKNVGLLALCEVSLGTWAEKFRADYNAHNLAAGFHSVKGVGRVEPDPQCWQTIDGDVKVPVGKLITPPDRSTSECTLQFNEYIVYDPTQIRLRFLMKIRFNFN